MTMSSSCLAAQSVRIEVLERCAKIAEIFAAIAVATGLLVAYFSYQAEKTARLERFTFEYAREYHAPSMHQSRIAIRQKLREVEPDLPRYSFSDAGLGQILLTDLSDNPDAEIEFHLIAVADYFNGAKNCVLAGLCDADVLRRLHSAEATSLKCLIGPSLTSFGSQAGASALLDGIVYFADDRECRI